MSGVFPQRASMGGLVESLIPEILKELGIMGIIAGLIFLILNREIDKIYSQ